MNEEIQNDNKIKHLEFIQLVITRMNINSFLLKGWTVTIVSALFAFAVKDATHYNLFFIPFIATFIFWGLDSYYLYQERLFRYLYDDVRSMDSKLIDFSMKTGKYQKKYKWFDAVISNTILFFYVGLIVIIFLVIYLMK
jgi:hypothetical protein